MVGDSGFFQNGKGFNIQCFQYFNNWYSVYLLNINLKHIIFFLNQLCPDYLQPKQKCPCWLLLVSEEDLASSKLQGYVLGVLGPEQVEYPIV